MIAFEDALKLIAEHAVPRESVDLDLTRLVGLTSAEDVHSSLDMPPFDKSAMDGYALDSRSVASVPASLKLAGSVQAGESFLGRVEPGQCVKIMTGAPVPSGADCVVKVEDTRIAADRAKEDRVEILRAAAKNDNICFQGEDMQKGQLVLERGTTIRVSHVALLAAAGRSSVQAICRPRVAVVNTGGEIIPAGSAVRDNEIYNSNGPQLLALLRADGIEGDFLGIVRDDFEELKQVLAHGLNYDILLVSGGVSMGDYDLVPEVLTALEVDTIFHNVRVKPGKPLFFGKRNAGIVFGIPGNPVSNFTTYQLFVRTAIHKMSGRARVGPAFEEGALATDFRQTPGRRHFVLVTVRRADRNYLTPVDSRGSADILALSRADGLMMLDESRETVKRGEAVPFMVWP